MLREKEILDALESENACGFAVLSDDDRKEFIARLKKAGMISKRYRVILRDLTTGYNYAYISVDADVVFTDVFDDIDLIDEDELRLLPQWVQDLAEEVVTFGD